MAHIFLSYRRTDSSDVTGRIFDALCKIFGEKNIFKDVDSIPLSVKFADFIKYTLAKSKVVIVVIGPNWVSKRLNDRSDFVRQEIETALQLDVPIVPVIVGGGSIPEKSVLPNSLRPLVELNGQPIRSDPDFHKDIARLVRKLEKLGLRRRKFFTAVRRIFNVTLVIIALTVTVSVFFLYWKSKPASELVAGYGLAYPKVNVSRGELEAEWATCTGECLERVTKSVHLAGKLEAGGFAVLNLWKPSNILGVWSARLPRGSLYFRIAAPVSEEREILNVEIAVKDSEKDEAHFKCSIPTDHQPRNFVISAEDLVATRVDLNDLELISIGVSTAVRSLPGYFKMSIYGISTQPVVDAVPLVKIW